MQPSLDPEHLRWRYLDLVKTLLRRDGFPVPGRELEMRSWKRHLLAPFRRALDAHGYKIRAERPLWYAGETMVTRERLDNLQFCAQAVLDESVPGDFVEAGIWRGGTAILMRAVLAANNISDRVVWAADSFAGFPNPDDRGPLDRNEDYTAGLGEELFVVTVEEVRENFARYGLLDEHVRFLEGWFESTLPTSPIERIALLRIDADLYASTRTVLTALFPKLAPDGIVIIDDYGTYEPCRRAVDEFRDTNGISSPLREVDGEAVWWRNTEPEA